MKGDQRIKCNLIFAVSAGNLERVRETISSFGLSCSQPWSEGYGLLRVAVYNEHTEVAKLLLTYGSSVNNKNEKATDTPRHFAVINGDVDIVQMLLNRGANIDAENQCGNTPLHNAVESKKMEIVEFLVNQGAHVNVINSEGLTPLHLAVQKSSEVIIKLLLKHGAYVNPAHTSTFCESYTPLWYAVQEGSENVIQLLLECGANVHAQDDSGKTIPHFAVEEGHEKVVKLLLECGAKVDAQDKGGKTALHIAVEEGHVKVVKLLLQCGANIDAQDKDGKTTLQFAVEKGHDKVAKELLECGANIDAQDKDGKTALQFAVEKGHEKVVKLLLECRANIHAEDKDGKTVLHSAVKRGYEEGFKLLLEVRANVGAQDKWGKSAPQYAVERRVEEMIKLLLECGANVNAQDKDGKSVLHFAVEKGHEEVVNLLLEHGANVDAQDKDGKTVLHSAVEKGCSVIIEHVLKHCPDVNNKSNRSAVNVAVHGYGREYRKIVENLLQYGLTVNPEVVNNYKLLHDAVEKGYLKIVEELLKYGIDVNMPYKCIYGRGYMPLHIETKNKLEEVAKLLISYGADVNAQDETGKTPVFYAVQNGDVKTTRLLLTNKANVKENPELLTIAVKKECREIVESLLQHGTDVNASDECGNTALHFTVLGEDRESFGSHLRNDPDSNVKGEIAKLLLSRGADVNAQTKDGVTILHAATEKGYVKVVEALLEYNADVNSTVKTDRTVPKIFYEIKRRRYLVAVNSGANVNSKDLYDSTPLHIAAHADHLAVVKILLKFGASVGSKDEYGRTALHIASYKAHEQIVTALLEHGSDINVVSEDHCTPFVYAEAGMVTRHNFSTRSRRHPSGAGKILQHHIVMMKTANLYVSEKNLLFVFYNDKIRHFQDKCEEEIARMKSEMISNSIVSFYDIVTKGTSQLAAYARNKRIVEIVRSGDCKRRFPIYAGMIKCNFRKGERRKEMLEQGNKFFHFCFNNFPQLPHDCTDKILSYLSDEDLRIFINASKLVSIQHT